MEIKQQPIVLEMSNYEYNLILNVLKLDTIKAKHSLDFYKKNNSMMDV